jgi:biopolymer transport protein ExbD
VKLTLVLADNGKITCEGRDITMAEVEPLVRERIRKTPETAVIVVADKASSTGLLIRLMDQAKSAGAPTVSIAPAHSRTPPSTP